MDAMSLLTAHTMVRMGLIVKIIIPIAVAAGTVLVIMAIPVLGFQYTFWRMHQILDNVPESELIDRTKDLPEVKAFLEKYGSVGRSYIMTDFHIDVIYEITDCELTGEYCDVVHPFAAYLDIRISLDTGFPEFSIFSCDGESYGQFPLGDEVLIKRIRNC